ncbi:MAG TPA: dTDP-4-dehydrorhamnose reductase [Solirubrobacteraceae bacterium]|jgi:dTDP-4-dehydrorhamnose reductase
MRILITGAAGMLGQDVSAAAEAAGHEAISLPRTELDIADSGAVERALAEAAPDAVVNCAAWTDVDGAESEYERALAVNGPGAGNLARAAAGAGAWTIHVSTDYVFDGSKHSPYVESDPVGPRSGYGRSKLEGERSVAHGAPGRHTVVRSSWLFGAGGGCFPKTILRLAGERDRLTVVDDQIGCPTFTGHLATALVELAAGGERAPVGLLHVAGGGECSWYEFAREIVSGMEGCEVVPVSSAEFVRPAPRPAYSVLRSERGAPVLPHWRQGLSEFMALTANAQVP